MSDSKPLLEALVSKECLSSYEKLNWEGSFDDYLEIVKQNPKKSDIILANKTKSSAKARSPSC